MNQILNSHKEKLFKAIEATDGLNPLQFRRVESENKFKLEFEDSGLYFKLVREADSYELYKWLYSNFDPKRSITDYYKKLPQNIDEAILEFRSWLKNIVLTYVKESKIIDPWESVVLTAEQYFSNADSESHFTAEQLLELESKLWKFRENVILSFDNDETKLEKKKLEEIDASIKMLIAESKKQSKFNWFSIAFTLITAIWPNIIGIDYSRAKQYLYLLIDLLKSIPRLNP